MKDLKELYNLLNSYYSDFKKDNDIKLLYQEDDIYIKIDEKYSYRILRIHIYNNSILIDDLSDDNERIEIFRLNYILYQLDNDNRFNQLILDFIEKMIDILE